MRRILRKPRLTVESLENRLVLTGQLVISEILANNDSVLADEDGDFSDWLEIYNPTSESVDLDGWHLTDEADDLTQWRFPAATLNAGERLVLFASGKDRVTAGGEWHTNFQLNSQGEYLALVEPDGTTIAFEFAPEYPRQREDISFGLVQAIETLVDVGTDVDTLVPSGDSLNLEWTRSDFDDSLWSTGTTGIGFEAGEGQGSTVAYGNLLGSEGTQNYGGSLGMDFVAHEPIVVTDLGVFDSNADGLSRTITAQLWFRSGNSGTMLAQLSFTPADAGELVESDRLKPLPTPLTLPVGDYTIVAYGYGSGESNGNAGTGGPGADQKTLDNGNGVLSFVGGSRYGDAGAFPTNVDSGPENRYSAGTFRYIVSAYDALIETDLESQMHNVNASVYSRIDFDAVDADHFGGLDLQMQYDDGFVAYLNGVEIARSNVTGAPTWNGTADGPRSSVESTQFETFNASAHLDVLRTGTNTLAIHGLNADAGDADFLISPRLIASAWLEDSPAVYFDIPTPGAPNEAASAFAGFVEGLDFSAQRGFRDEPFEVEIVSQTEGATIRYTTNGETPTEFTGEVYNGPISIETTTTLMAAAFKSGFESTPAVTHSYVFLDAVVDMDGAPAGYPAMWSGFTADYAMSQNADDLPLIAGDGGLSVEESKEVIRDSLLAIPTMSIVLPMDDLFDAQDGIYANPANRGDAWERAASVEYLLPNGDKGFQINAGIQIMGGTSRNLDRNIKQSFRLVFKEEYGPGRLEYEFFPDNPVDSFNTLPLRSNSRDNWTSHQYTNSATYLRDEWAKQTALDMGGLATSGSFVHLYLNGMYWGIYNPTERPDAAFMASHIGADEDAVDTVKFCCPQRVVDGDWDEWNELRSLSAAGLADNASYQRIQGNNPDGTRNPDFDVLIDIDNFIDYVIHGQFTGSEDWPGNYYVARDSGPDSEGFKFFTWDNDLAFRRNDKVTPDPGHNWWTESPGEIDIALRQNAEYRLRFADRVQQYYFNGGPLTSEASIARWNQLVDGLGESLIAESARWGDYRRDVDPIGARVLFTPDNQWLSTLDSIVDYFEDRPETVLSQLRSRDLYPDIGAPVFQINGTDQHGGSIVSGDTLSMTAAAATITTETTLVAIDSLAKAFVPTDNSLETGLELRWYDVGFDSADWITGTNGVGYDNGSDYASLIGTDVTDAWNAADRTSVYSRFEFDLAADFDAAAAERLELNMKYDDGYAVYLNGQLVHSKNTPSPIEWNSRATGKRLNLLNTIASVVETVDVSDSLDLLQPGPNVLAIHILNNSTDMVDILARPELILGDDAEVAAPIIYTMDGSDPREAGGAAAGITYDATITLTDTTAVHARALVNGEWSALSQAIFVVTDFGNSIAISEINYNPHEPTAAELVTLPDADNDDFEFIEVTNTSAFDAISLVGMQFVDGVTFAFGNQSLAPGESAVLVRDLSAFRLRYGESIRVFGEWSGGLANGGETLQLVDGTGESLVEFTYDDSIIWPASADGVGATLELVDRMNTSATRYGNADSWRGSTDFGGSPGTTGTPRLGIVINEVLTHTDPPLTMSDSIELLNTTDQAIDIGGWYLSDSATTLFKYEIPAGTIVGPGQYIVFDESHFNRTPLNPGPNDFALSGARGDDVWLVVSDGMGPDGLGADVQFFVDDVHFGAAINGASFGRLEPESIRLVPLSARSLGCKNSHPFVGSLIISEVNYNPSDPTDAALAVYPSLTTKDLEFIEIHNPTSRAVDLTDWRIRGGVDFEAEDFETGITIGVGQTFVVTRFNSDAPDNADRGAAFRAHYGIDTEVTLVGGYSGSLANDGERVTLQRPDESPLDDPDFIPHVVEDEVIYDDLLPWPIVAGGESLERVTPVSFGSSHDSWAVSAASPGMANFVDGVAGDLTGDGKVTAGDIDLLNAMINRGTTVKTYDLDGSGTVDSADRVFLVENIMGTFMGDANLDGHVNVADLNVVGLHWQQTGDCLTWSNGNFDGNERVDAADLNAVGINWLAAVAQARVPRAPLATRVALVDASLADLGSETVVSRRTYIQTSSSIAQSSNVAQGSNIAQGSNERAGVGMRPSRWEQVMRRRFSGIV